MTSGSSALKGLFLRHHKWDCDVVKMNKVRFLLRCFLAYTATPYYSFFDFLEFFYKKECAFYSIN